MSKSNAVSSLLFAPFFSASALAFCEAAPAASALSISPKISMSDFLDRLAEKGVLTIIKISEEGEILGISYALDGVAFAGRKLGRNKSSCTLLGLQQRGVKISLNDLDRMVKHSQLEGEENMGKIIHNSQNKNLLWAKESILMRNKGIELVD